MNSKGLTSSLLALCVVGAGVTPALAVTADGDGSGESAITMIVEGDTTGGGGDPDVDVMDITVPAVLPILADTEGNVAVPENAKIINNSKKHSVQIVELVTENRDWELVDYDEDLSAEADNVAKLGLKFNGDKLSKEGKISLTSDRWWIDKSGELALDIEAKLPRQTVASKREAANIQYTIDWDKKREKEEALMMELQPALKGESENSLEGNKDGVVGDESKPNQGEMKPSTGENEPSKGENEPSAGETKPNHGEDGTGEDKKEPEKVENGAEENKEEADKVEHGTGENKKEPEKGENAVVVEKVEYEHSVLSLGNLREVKVVGKIKSIDIVDDTIINYIDRVDTDNGATFKIEGKAEGIGEIKVVFESGKEELIKVEIKQENKGEGLNE